MVDSIHDSLSALRAEVETLKAQLSRLTVAPTNGGGGVGAGFEPALAPDQRTDRRGLLKVVGAAAAGVAGASLLSAAPAGATGTANGDAVDLGDANTCTATTSITTTTGIGISGNSSATGTSGVYGTNNTAAASGVYGQASLGNGVYGQSTSGIGVYGVADTASGLLANNAGVIGDSSDNTGVIGLSSAVAGVYGNSSATGSSGVYGVNNTADANGVYGQASVGNGVYGQSTSGIGVYGVSDSPSGLIAGETAGVIGDTSNGYGVVGLSSDADGVVGFTSADTGNAVYGYGTGTSSVGVSGEGASYGVSAQGGLAPLFLTPASSAGAPTTGVHRVGEFYVDTDGVFYKCVVAGTPGTWVALYSVIPLLAPKRVISTPSGAGNTGGLTGPFASNGDTHTTSVLTGGSTGIPDIAVGVVGNLTISANGAVLNGDGYLTPWPAGTTYPDVSSINSGGDAFATSNGLTVAFGTDSSAGKLSFSWRGGGSPPDCQVYLDVSAYIL